MLVVAEQLHPQLDVKEASTPELQRGPPGLVEGCARLPKAAVGAQLVGVLVGDLLEGLGANLFFAFHEKPQSHRHLAQLLQCLQRVDPRHDVGLVVSDPSGDDAAVLLDGLKRVGVPELDGINRLDVVVLVEQQLAAAGAGHLGIQSRHAAFIECLHPVGEPTQPLGDPAPSRLHGFEPMVRDAREGAELFELIYETPGVLFDVRVDGAG